MTILTILLAVYFAIGIAIWALAYFLVPKRGPLWLEILSFFAIPLWPFAFFWTR